MRIFCLAVLIIHFLGQLYYIVPRAQHITVTHNAPPGRHITVSSYNSIQLYFYISFRVAPMLRLYLNCYKLFKYDGQFVLIRLFIFTVNLYIFNWLLTIPSSIYLYSDIYPFLSIFIYINYYSLYITPVALIIRIIQICYFT